MIEDIIMNLTIIVGLFPLSVFLLRKPNPVYNLELTAIKPSLWLLFIGAVYELIFTTFLYVSTAPWIHLYYLLEFLTLYYFFKTLFERKHMLLLNSFLIVYVITWIVLTTFWFEIRARKDDAFLGTLQTVFVYTFVLLWVRQLFKKVEIESLWKEPVFYFIIGFIFFFIGAFFVNLLNKDIFRLTGTLTKYWMISVLLNLIMRVLLIVGVWKATTIKKSV